MHPLPPNPEMRALRVHLVKVLKDAEALRSDSVERAFQSVPRHVFLPEADPSDAYSDTAVVTKWRNGRPVSSASQPRIVAEMLEQLDIKRGMRILEIGTGTGYNAALLAHLSGPQNVVTVEIDPELSQSAYSNLQKIGYGQVMMIQGDAADLAHSIGRFDRIIVTVGAWDILPSWVEALSPKGKIVVPLSLNGIQCTSSFEKAGKYLKSSSVNTGGFMTMEGLNAGPRITASANDGSTVLHEWPESLPDQLLYSLLDRTTKRIQVAELKEGYADGSLPFLYFFALNGYRIMQLLGSSPALVCIDPACEVAFRFPGNSLAEGWLMCESGRKTIKDFLRLYRDWLSLSAPSIADVAIRAEMLPEHRPGEARVRRIGEHVYEVEKAHFRYEFTYPQNHGDLNA